jgi:hypothetical protein
MMKNRFTDLFLPGTLFYPNQKKNYFIPLRMNHTHAWILPANFYLHCEEWTILFELEEVRIYLKINSEINICLQKKMNSNEKNQFEKEWLTFQSSTEETFDLRGFNLLD